MKRISIVLVFILVSVWAIGQESSGKHEFSATGFGGLSTLQYSVQDGVSRSMGFGGGGGLGYMFSFTSHWGLRTGIDLSVYTSSLECPGTFTVSSLALKNPPITPVPPAGADARFYVHSTYTDYEESQTAMFLQIPVMAQFTYPFGGNSFYASAGVKFGLPVSSTYDSKANAVTYVGESKYTGQLYTEDYGFTTKNNISHNGDFDLKFTCFASAEAGLKWGLSSRLGLYTGVYFDYGLTDANNSEDAPAVEYSGSAVTGYNSIVTSAVHPMAVGLKLRIAFR